MGAVVILQGSCRVETAKAPKYCSFPWRYTRTFTNRVGVDAERNSDELRREEPRRESDRPGEPFPRDTFD